MVNPTIPPRPGPKPLSQRADARRESGSQQPPLGRWVERTGLGPIRWIRENTFAPDWLPEHLRHPAIGYLVATFVDLVALAVILLLLYSFPGFNFYGIFALAGVMFVALGWGAGPSLFATAISVVILDGLVLSPRFSWVVSDPADSFGLFMYLVVGAGISLLAGRIQRARRQAEETSNLLARAEARSRFHAERLRTVLDVLPSSVLITSSEGKLLDMNQASRAMWGEDIAVGTDFTEFSQQNRFQAWWATSGEPISPEEWTLARALASGEAVQNDEIEIEVPDGQHKVILNSAASLRDENGTVTGAVISAVDISELRRLEREVASHVQELEAIFEAITDGITVLDSQGRLVRTNSAFRRLSGSEEHPEFLAIPMERRLTGLAMRDEHGLPLPVEAWPANRLLRGESLTGVDVIMTTLDGRDMVFNMGGAPIRDKQGRVIGCVGVFRDVTARRYLEQRTRETLGALVGMAEAMVQIRPTALDIQTADEAPLPHVADATLPLVARRLAELTRAVLGCRRVSIEAVDAPTGLLEPVMEVGLPPVQEGAWWDSWSSAQFLEERFGSQIAAGLYAGLPSPLDAAHLPERSWYTLFGAKSGQIVPMRLGEDLVGILLVDYAEPHHDYSQEEEVMLTGTLARLGALVLERDRLLRGWAEARANELVLEETKAQMDTFLGIASHELKTPLTSLKLSLQVTERRLRKLATTKNGAAGDAVGLDSTVEQLGRTSHQVKRLEALVNDLVDVSRIQAGRLELRPEPVDLAEIVREAVLEQRQAAPDREIRLQMPATVSLPVYADAGRIEQVVTNYLTNALKYSAAAQPVEVGVAEQEGRQGRVWVRDFGPGLPAEEQEQIWERFHRVRGVEVQSGAGVGLGLGLYISRMIVERHQGDAGVQSTLGEGSTFWFTLPLRNAGQDQ